MKYVVIQEVLAKFDWTYFPVIGFFLFLAIFFGVLFIILRPKSGEDWNYYASMALDQDSVTTRRKM